VTPLSRRTATGGDGAVARAASPLFGFGIVLGSAALFGMLGPLSRFAYEAGMTPAAFVAWRAGIGLVGLGLYVIWRVRRRATAMTRLGDLSRRDRMTLALVAVTGFTLNACMFFAFERISIALALLGFYTYPAMVAVVNVLLGRERLDGARALALGLAITGMIAILAPELDPGTGIAFDLPGVALALGAAVSQTVFVVVSRDGYRHVPAEQAIALVLFVTIVGSALLAALSGQPATLAEPLRRPDVLPLLLFTGIFAAAIPSLGFLTGIRRIGGTRAGILMLFEPVVGVVLAAWLLAEGLAPIQVVGAVAILAAALVLQRAAHAPRGTPLGDGAHP
jgi:drug/metabolite transporter (DMT)-like permease